MICLYLKIPENVMLFILQDRFWFVRVPFCKIFKFQSLAQFQVDHHPPSQSNAHFGQVCYSHFYVIHSFISIIKNLHMQICYYVVFFHFLYVFVNIFIFYLFVYLVFVVISFQAAYKDSVFMPTFEYKYLSFNKQFILFY